MKKLLLTFLKDIQAVPSYLPHIPLHEVIFGVGVSTVILIFLYWIKGKEKEVFQKMMDSDESEKQLDKEGKNAKAKRPFFGQITKNTICLTFLIFYLVFLSLL